VLAWTFTKRPSSVSSPLMKRVDDTKNAARLAPMTPDLLTVLDWLPANRCTHVAMESTGVFWRPVFNLLEEGRQVILVNAQHMKAVAGRKTDVKDAEWIADLLQHGLLRPSFIPPMSQRELRELTQYPITLIEERSRTILRLQKGLEDANIKLASVVSDMMGKSARASCKHCLLKTLILQSSLNSRWRRCERNATCLNKPQRTTQSPSSLPHH